MRIRARWSVLICVVGFVAGPAITSARAVPRDTMPPADNATATGEPGGGKAAKEPKEQKPKGNHDPFFKRVKNVFIPEDSGPRLTAKDETDDKHIVFRIGGMNGMKARVETIVNEQAVSVWSQEEGNAAGKTSKVEGNLNAVAMAALKAKLFDLSPDTLVTEKATAPEDHAYTYRVSIDEFKEFRNKNGDFIYAIDAKLDVLKGDGSTAQRTIEYHFPEKKSDRLTDEEFQQIIAKNETAVVALDSLDEATSNSTDNIIGLAMNFGAKYGKKKKEMELEKQKLNLVSKSPNVKTYQMQESLVRKAVEQLMDFAVAPGGSEGLSAEFKYKKVAKTEQDGRNYLDQGNTDEALKRWAALGTPSPAVKYNLGVIHLRLASSDMKSDPAGAIAHLEQAKNYLDGLHTEYKGEAQLLTLPVNVLVQLQPAGSATPSTPTTGNGTPAPPSGEIEKPYDKWALLIGVNKFENGAYPALTGPSNDVKTLKGTLLGLGFPASNILTLENDSVTIASVREKFGELQRNIGANSLVVVSVASHGTAGSGDLDGYIICHDSAPDRLYETAYHMNEFRAMAAYLPCKQKVLVQDTCHSAASKNVAFPTVPPFMAIFSSADANQLALETKGNGLFMKYFAQGIKAKKGKLTLSELADYVKTKVSADAQKLGTAQNPKIDFGPQAQLLKLNY